MNTITTKDGTEIYYKDWDSGQPVVFSHGCSRQSRNGSEMDTYADDLSELLETLDLNGTILVGHLTIGGDAARTIGHHVNKRIARALLMGAVTPRAATATRSKKT